MILARVVGNVVATQKNENLVGKKLLLIQPVDAEGIFYGSEVLAVDGVGAGIGDLVIAIAEGGSARLVTNAKSPLAPIEVCIAGIVDTVNTEAGILRN
jgi:ethanolamine utilization protein EutN